MRKGQRLNTHSEPSKSRPKPFYTQNSSKNGTPTEWNNKKKQCKSFGGKLLLTLLYQLISWAMDGKEGGDGGGFPCVDAPLCAVLVTASHMPLCPWHRAIATYTTRALELVYFAPLTHIAQQVTEDFIFITIITIIMIAEVADGMALFNSNPPTGSCNPCILCLEYQLTTSWYTSIAINR